MIKWPRSLRVRLQIWHAIILFCVVASFGSLLYRQVVVSRWDEVDAGLLAAGRVLEGAMRDVPRPVLDSLAQDIGNARGGHPVGPPKPNAGPTAPGQQPGQQPGPQPPGVRPPGARPPGPPALVERGPAQLEWETAAPLSLDDAWEQGVQLPRRLPVQLSDRAGPAYYIIWRDDGSILKQQDVPYAHPNRPRNDRLLQQVRMTYQRDVGPLREVFVRGPHNTLICVGRPVGGELHRLWTLAGQLLLAGAAILAAGLCGGWWLSRSAVEPIERMTATAGRISAVNLSERVDVANIDHELEQLARVMNDMLGRLQHSFETQKRFAADASHELRTPLATILSTIELSLSRPRQPEEYQQQLVKCQRAAQRMNELVASLLQLTRSDAGAEAPRREPTQLDELVQEVVDGLRDAASSRSIELHCHVQPVTLLADPGQLRQVVTNLVQNAIAYNRENGSITVQLVLEQHTAVLTVSDTGIGIEAEHLPHIFDRFYRVDKSRGHASGYGLGLSITQSIVQAHGGVITASSQPGAGSQFTVTFPLGELPSST